MYRAHILKLLRIIRSLNPNGGGPIEGLKQVTPHLLQYGIETTVASLDHPESAWLSDLPFSSVALGPVWNDYGYHPTVVTRLSQLLTRYDCLIVEGLWQYHALASLLALRITPKPYFVFVHGMLDPWFNKTYPFKFLKKAAYWPFADYKLLRDSTGILYTTATERDLARTSFIPYQGSEYVVGYGANPFSSPSHSEVDHLYFLFPELRNKQIFLFLGRIHPKKGVDLLLRAFASLSPIGTNLHLVLAGPVNLSYRDHLLSMIRTLKIESQVTWTGFIDGGIKSALLSISSLFCLPSHQENFGVSVAEALSLGLPVCISNAVNISDRIQICSAGIVHPDTVSGTTNSLKLWMTLTPAQRLSMSERASELFVTEFDWNQVSKNLSLLLYDKVPQQII